MSWTPIISICFCILIFGALGAWWYQSRRNKWQIESYEQQIAKAEQRLEKIQNAIEQYQQEYNASLYEGGKHYEAVIATYAEEVDKVKRSLEGYKSIARAAVADAQKDRADAEKQNYYRIQISDIDVQEIKKIREIEPYLRDTTPLNKVIWKSYYETPFGEMVGRVVGADDLTGIYKITNLKTQMIYIGQARHISKRFKEHVKKGIGADVASRNRLYTAMLHDGVENFTFEVLETCDIEDLDAHEAYWIDYFQTNISGYNMTVGNGVNN